MIGIPVNVHLQHIPSGLRRQTGSSGSPPGSPGRSLCVTREPQASVLCDPISPLRSGGHGRDVVGLEQVDQDLPLSTSEHFDEGSGQAEILLSQILS